MSDRSDARARLLAAYTDPTTPPFPGAVAMTCAECDRFLVWTNPPLPTVPTVCREHAGPGRLVADVPGEEA